MLSVACCDQIECVPFDKLYSRLVYIINWLLLSFSFAQPQSDHIKMASTVHCYYKYAKKCTAFFLKMKIEIKTWLKILNIIFSSLMFPKKTLSYFLFVLISAQKKKIYFGFFCPPMLFIQSQHFMKRLLLDRQNNKKKFL